MEAAAKLSISRKCVGKWRRRWHDSQQALLAIEDNQPTAVLKRAVEDVLQDDYRSGRPRTFSDQQVAKIISIGSQSPRTFNRPVDTWTGRELAAEAVLQKIVDSISTSRVNTFLKSVDLNPDLHKGWCFTTERDEQLFDAQVQEVCQVYLNAASLNETQGTHVVCVDEMTSLQANERLAAGKTPKPGQTGLRECQYIRHGTLSLTGSWDVVAGQMIAWTIAKTRTAEDFAAHILKTVQADPNGEWIFVMDNLNTHYGEPIVRAIAELLGMDQSKLGDKKKRKGILGCVASRKEFLTDVSHRIRFVFIPKHSSWLNQIERVFGVISARVMRYGNFTSVEDLEQKLTTFIDYFNKTFAKPISWKYDGKPRRKNDLERPRTWREKRKPNRKEKILQLVA